VSKQLNLFIYIAIIYLELFFKKVLFLCMPVHGIYQAETSPYIISRINNKRIVCSSLWCINNTIYSNIVGNFCIWKWSCFFEDSRNLLFWNLGFWKLINLYYYSTALRQRRVSSIVDSRIFCSRHLAIVMCIWELNLHTWRFLPIYVWWLR